MDRARAVAIALGHLVVISFPTVTRMVRMVHRRAE
jgi:hypothetical protein